MPNAHKAAVEVMAEAIMRPDVRKHYQTDPHPAAAAYYRERATDALAAVVRSEAVRAALVADLEGDGALRWGWHVNAILAALAPPEPE